MVYNEPKSMGDASYEVQYSKEKYNLPVCDTQKERRNFSGYEKNEYYTLADMQATGQAGTTETDSQTDSPSGGYSAINKKSGKVKDWGGKKLSADTSMLGPDTKLQYGKETG